MGLFDIFKAGKATGLSAAPQAPLKETVAVTQPDDKVMLIEIKRVKLNPGNTIGELFINGAHECWTIEDTVRELPGQPVSSWKIPAKTAIPAGEYNVIITMSSRFKLMLPLLENVPGFDGVRIHTGNTAEDTEGCIIVGQVARVTRVDGSKLAFEPLYQKINNALSKGYKVKLRIS